MPQDNQSSGVKPTATDEERRAAGAFFEMAKQIELQGMEYYAKLAEEIPLAEISGIFKFLAEEEKRHYYIFDALQKKLALPAPSVLQALMVARKAFQRMSEQFRTVGLPAMDYADAYEKALGFENKSVSVYEEQLALIENSPEHEKQKTVLKSIIHQEKGHALLITALMEFNRNPGEWLENAEWTHLEEF